MYNDILLTTFQFNCLLQSYKGTNIGSTGSKAGKY